MLIKYLMSTNPVTINKNKNIAEALKSMEKNKVSSLLVVDNNKKLVGIVTEKDIAGKLLSSKYENLPPSHIYVSTAMTKDPITVSPNITVGKAADIMLENRISNLPVVENGELVGIITKTDLLDVCKCKPYRELKVKDAMSTEIITIGPTDSLLHARRIMVDTRIGRLPVMDDDILVGIITARDVAKAIIAYRKIVPDKYKSSRIRNLLVQDIMVQNVRTVSANLSISEVTEKLISYGFGGFPVMNDELEGLITKTDILDVITEIEGV